MADELAVSSDAVDGFLETPALALAARDLAQDEAPLAEGTLVGPYRIVALLAGTDSIRDVIAFPKSGNGFDPLTAAPTPITPAQRKEAGVDFAPKVPTQA